MRRPSLQFTAPSAPQPLPNTRATGPTTHNPAAMRLALVCLALALLASAASACTAGDKACFCKKVRPATVWKHCQLQAWNKWGGSIHVCSVSASTRPVLRGCCCGCPCCWGCSWTQCVMLSYVFVYLVCCTNWVPGCLRSCVFVVSKTAGWGRVAATRRSPSSCVPRVLHVPRCALGAGHCFCLFSSTVFRQQTAWHPHNCVATAHTLFHPGCRRSQALGARVSAT